MKYLWPILAFLGFLDSSYLAIKHFTGSDVPCTTSGCEIVLTSKYSVMAGIPLAYIGVLYYLVVLVLALLFLQTQNRTYLKLGMAGVLLGILFSAYFVYLQIAVIHSICLYCMGSALTTTLLVILLGYLNLKPKRPVQI
ncbi:MAG: vitamin K epoxide reductase family protein [Acidobacteriaceae bacterium]